MAVWTPGSYLVREYARNVEGARGHGRPTGKPLAVEKVRKNRWKVDDRRAPSVGPSRTASTAARWACRPTGSTAAFALLNGAGDVPDPRRRAAPAPRGRRSSRPRLAQVAHRPARRARQASRTTTSPPTSTRWSTARSTSGNPTVYEFEVDGKPHLPRQRGRGRRLGRPAVGPGRRGDRQGAARTFWGSAPLRQVRLLQPARPRPAAAWSTRTRPS